MKVNILVNDRSNFPAKLLDIPQPPKKLYVMGDVKSLESRPVVSIVGSRAATPYGRQVTERLATDLALKDVIIVSGLALGVDAIAHKSCLAAGGTTVAVLPSPVDQVYPATNRQLAKRILEQGGGLLSEYGDVDRSEAFKSRFIARNRIVSGLADILLITEAGERSGTLHTANFALDQGRTVMAVPGNINSPGSKGTNNLIKAGALPVTEASDIFAQLGIEENNKQQQILASSKEEVAIIDALLLGITDSSDLLAQSGLSAPQFNQTLTMLEISGKVKPLGAGHWSLS